MLKAVCLDLDNTLFLFDEPAFYTKLFQRLVPYFADLIPPDQFEDRLRRSFQALQQNDGRVPNSLCFLDTFCFRFRARLPAVWQRFFDFYATEYDRIQTKGEPVPGVNKVIDHLHAKGLKLAVATNPIFPLIAQEKRLAWSGVIRERFELITHMENMSFVKPHKGYFRQVCEFMGLAPRDCLMVGNDPVNDMAAGDAGLMTYLVTDARDLGYRWSYMTSPGENVRPPDRTGPLAHLPEAVDRWMQS